MVYLLQTNMCMSDKCIKEAGWSTKYPSDLSETFNYDIFLAHSDK